MSAPPSNVRLCDRKDLSATAREDFVVRDRNPTMPQVYLLCFLPLIVVIVTSVMIYNAMLYGGLICVMVGIVTLFFALQTKKHQQVINKSEFLSALLASALTYDHRFCAILSQDNTIMYLDRGFQQAFPDFTNQPLRTLDVLLDMYKLSPEGQQKLLDILKQNIHASMIVPMENGASKQASDVHLFIDPIKRPGGFTLLRGK